MEKQTSERGMILEELHGISEDLHGVLGETKHSSIETPVVLSRLTKVLIDTVNLMPRER